MARAVCVVLVILAAQGHWFGGQEGTVSFQWTAMAKVPEATVSWELRHDRLLLASGQLPLKAGDEGAKLALTVPEVRVRTQMRLVYRVHGQDGKPEYAAGERVIHVYSKSLLASCAQALTGKTLLVVDGAEGLPRVLTGAGITHTRAEGISALQTAQADIILVGPDQLSAPPFGGDAEILAQARTGSSVLVFAQRSRKELAGYSLARRPLSARVQHRADHEIFKHLEEEDLAGIIHETGSSPSVIQLPPDEPTLELIYWARESPGMAPVPIDALMVTKAVGKGRIVLCQMPLGDWQRDPRSQALLAGMLGYALSRPEPTLPPGKRQPSAGTAAKVAGASRQGGQK